MAKSKTKKNGFRTICLAIFFICWLVAIVWRLAYLQFTQHEHYLARAERQQTGRIEVSPERGLIVDRHGHEMARSVQATSLAASPRQINHPEGMADWLAPLLGMKRGEILDRLSDQTKGFLWLGRKLNQDLAEKIREHIQHYKTQKEQIHKIEGLSLVSEPQRLYPNGSVASHVVGYVNIDEKGIAGLELKANEYLQGREKGWRIIDRDVRQQAVTRRDVAAVDGSTVVTTIDTALQHKTEQIISRARAATGAKSVSAIVMDPKTGEILALANAPDFDPNIRPKGDGQDEQMRRNRAINDVYDPGSVFKVVTWSAALEEKLARPDEKIDCLGGKIKIYDRVIRDSHPHGVLTVSDALAKSSNIAAIKLAQRLGNQRLAAWVDRFGFGKPTGVELPGERAGIVRDVKKWHGTSYASIAMGHEIGVTALQAVAALATIANQGVWVQPHIIQKVVGPDGQLVRETQPETRRVISSDTARTVSSMLESVVTKGTARNAMQLASYTAAGKTGTAQKVDPHTKAYSQTKYVASFAGFVPAKNPRFAIIVMLDEPVGAHQGGQVAAPLFSEIAEVALTDYAVKPDTDSYRERMAEIQQRARAVPGKVEDNGNAVNAESTTNLTAKSESAVRQTKPTPQIKSSVTTAQVRLLVLPTPAAMAAKNTLPVSTAKNIAASNIREVRSEPREFIASRAATSGTPAASVPAKISGSSVMPDLRGRSLRAVAQVCSELDVKLNVTGSGTVVRQFPQPGTRIRSGESIRVDFQ
jgi:cell division protein FtsI (penicillin-binding protein 3)